MDITKDGIEVGTHEAIIQYDTLDEARSFLVDSCPQCMDGKSINDESFLLASDLRYKGIHCSPKNNGYFITIDTEHRNREVLMQIVHDIFPLGLEIEDFVEQRFISCSFNDALCANDNKASGYIDHINRYFANKIAQAASVRAYSASKVSFVNPFSEN